MRRLDGSRRLVGAAALGLLGLAFALGEVLGWPGLGSVLAGIVGDRLGRNLQFTSHGQAETAATPRLHFLGGVKLDVPTLHVGGPAADPGRDAFDLHGLVVQLRYGDLISAVREQPLRIRALHVAQLGGHLELQLPASHVALPVFVPVFESLQIGRGQLQANDAARDLQVNIELGGELGPSGGRLRAHASGRGRAGPIEADVRVGAERLASEGGANPGWPVALRARVGAARLGFDGRFDPGTTRVASTGPLLQGRFTADGPSLAALGDALGIGLPASPAFTLEGSLAGPGQQTGAAWRHGAGSQWALRIERLAQGRSLFRGGFVYSPASAPGAFPRLAGRLQGEALWLADLGPLIGLAPGALQHARAARGRHLLPDRPFEFEALRQIDADIHVALDRLELGGPHLEALGPLQARVTVAGGVLALEGLQAQVGRGELRGSGRIDGRTVPASWQAGIGWADVRLEHWLHLGPLPAKVAGSAIQLAGRLDGRWSMAGAGRSTREMLASANGAAELRWTEGRLSHLAVEAAGLDVLRSLGLLVAGDEALPVTCGAADLQIVQGRLSPRVLLVDTPASTLWVDGSASLADESLDLTVHAAPKSASLLSLRAPVRVRGTFAEPEIAVENGPLLRKLVPAALLGWVNPLAALLPLMDAGGGNAAQAPRAGCRVLVERAAAAASAPAGAVGTRLPGNPPKTAVARAASDRR